MSPEMFENALIDDRETTIRRLLEYLVDAWLNAGKEEVVRVLTLWALRPVDNLACPWLDLGSDERLLEIAQNCGLVTTEEEGGCS